MFKKIIFTLIFILASCSITSADDYNDYRRNQLERDIKQNIEDIDTYKRRMDADPDGLNHEYYERQIKNNLDDLRDNTDQLRRLN